MVWFPSWWAQWPCRLQTVTSRGSLVLKSNPLQLTTDEKCSRVWTYLRSFLGEARCFEAEVGLRYEGVFLLALPGKRPGRAPGTNGLLGVLNLGAGSLEVDSGVFLGRVAAMYRLGVLAYLLLVLVGVLPGVVKYFF